MRKLFTLVFLVMAALIVCLVVLWNRNTSLQQELAVLRAHVSETAPMSEKGPRSSDSAAGNDELLRLRKNEMELLRLRSRVTQLTRMLSGTNSQEMLPHLESDASLSQEELQPVMTYASLTNRVESGQTFVVGGWLVNGMRRYLLLTPKLVQGEASSGGKPLVVESQVVTASERLWLQIGWDDFKSEAPNSTLAGVLTSEQLQILLKFLRQNGGGVASGEVMKRFDGEKIALGYSSSEADVMMGVDICPRIASDGHSVDLEILPNVPKKGN